jgi:hypothetical protein
MKLVVAAMTLAAMSTAVAQFPAGPVVSSAREKGPSEFRVAGIMMSGERSLEFANQVTTETGSLSGVEMLLRAEGAGISIRTLTGEFGDGNHVTSADARLYLMPRVFSLMLGATRRALWTQLNENAPTTFDFGMAGVSSTVNVGASGIRTNVNGAYYFPFSEQSAPMKSGMEGEVSVMYIVPRLPFFVQLGYRTEIFTQRYGTRLTPEEIRGIRFGGGLQGGGR